MLKFLRYIGDYWYIPVLFIGAVVVAYFFRKKGFSSATFVANELSVIDAKREVRDIKLQLGAEQAKQHVREKYREKLQRLDAKTLEKVKELEDDPVQLAITLERLSR